MIEPLLNDSKNTQIDSSFLTADLPALSLPPMGAQEWLFAGFLLCLIGLIVAEKRQALLKTDKTALRSSYLTNLKVFLFNDASLSFLQLPALYLIADNYSSSGLLSEMSSGPGKILAAFLLLDLCLYGWHYYCHHCDWLWYFHRVHHSDRCVNVTTGLRYHMGELLLETLLRSIFIVVVGVSAETLLICQGLMSLFILMHHSNLRLPGESWLSKVFVMPGLHRLHHSVVRSEHDSNFGAALIAWDRLFGTLRHGEPRAIGLAGVNQDSFTSILKDLLPLRTLNPIAGLSESGPVLQRLTAKAARAERQS